MKNKTLWRKVSSVVLTFTLAILFFGVNIIIGLNLGVFHNGTIENSIRESKYYEESYEQLKTHIQELLSGTDIPKEAIFEVVSLQHFYIDARTHLQHVLNGDLRNGSTDVQVAMDIEDIKAAISPYLQEHDIKKQTARIEELSQNILTTYQEQIAFDLAEDIVGYRDRFVQYSALVLIGVLILSVITLRALNKMHQRWYKALRYLAYSIAGASGMMLIFIFMLSQRIDYSSIIPEPVYYQRFIEIYSNESLKALIYPVIIGAIIFNVLLVMIKEMKRRITLGQDR